MSISTLQLVSIASQKSENGLSLKLSTRCLPQIPFIEYQNGRSCERLRRTWPARNSRRLTQPNGVPGSRDTRIEKQIRQVRQKPIIFPSKALHNPGSTLRFPPDLTEKARADVRLCRVAESILG